MLRLIQNGELRMASWIAHLYVAENMLDHINADPLYFAAGNIAPDCGERIDYRVFLPDTKTTHFTKADKDACEYENFYEKYVRKETLPQRRSFFAGYYAHLYTDVLWTKTVVKEEKEKYADMIKENGEDIFYKKMKGDWYGLDFHFLKAHPDMRMWRLFCDIDEFPNTYLPFYPKDAFTKKFRQIREFYSSVAETRPRRFRYMQPEEWEDFAKKAAGIITSDLAGKGLGKT